MKKEHLPPEPKQNGSKEQKTAADDLKFMRLAAEKSYRQLKPETHVTIIWGLICMAAYISIHFLAKPRLFKWITPLYLSLMAIGLCYTFITFLIVIKRQKKGGFIPLLFGQVGWIWLIVMFPVIFWDRMGLFKNIFCKSGFIYAMGLSIALGVTGIFHSKVWYLGGIIIFAGMLIAFFAIDYVCPFIILGLATGVGLIIPAVITDINYRKQETDNA